MGADFGSTDFFGDLSVLFGEDTGGGGDPGPPSVEKLATAIRRLARYDGLRIRSGGSRGEQGGARAYRAPDIRIAGSAATRVRVVGR
jgi:hypothetical protein